MSSKETTKTLNVPSQNLLGKDQKLKLNFPSLAIPSPKVSPLASPSGESKLKIPKLIIPQTTQPIDKDVSIQPPQVQYNINIISDENDDLPISSLSKRKQNNMLLSVNTIPGGNSNVNTSETELSPGGSRGNKPNYLMKCFFNNSHSPTPERDATGKRGSFKKSPIQQYFNDASPRGANVNDTSLYDLTKTPERTPERDSRSFNNEIENATYGYQKNKSFNNSYNGENNYDFNLNNELFDYSWNNPNEDDPNTINNNSNFNNTIDNNVIENVIQIPNSPIRLNNSINNNNLNVENFNPRGFSPITPKNSNLSSNNHLGLSSNTTRDKKMNMYMNSMQNSNINYNQDSNQNFDMGYQQQYNNGMNPQMGQQRFNNMYNTPNNANYRQYPYKYNQNFLTKNYNPVYQQQAMYMNQPQIPIQQIPPMNAIPQMMPNQFPPNPNGPIPKNAILPKNSRRITNTSNLYKMDNNEIAKQSHNLAKDQIGCRFLQKKIEEDTKFAISSIYPVILDHLLDTINDQFGNYLIQKFFEYLSNEELYQFFQMISPSFENIGINQYGTRVIQKIMDYIKSDSTNKLYNTFIEILTPNIVLFSNDINGCHIIQKVLLTKNFDNTFAYKEMENSIDKIANHKNGCCFLQKLTEKLKGNELENLLDAINKKAKILIIDQYGNYVIQHIMKINGVKRNLLIFSMLIDNLPFYSNQKFSSNVIEKFFAYEEMKLSIVKKLLIPNVMKEMLYDSFGNYVVQKALANAGKEYQVKLLCLIAPLMEGLKNLNFGVKLYHKLTVQYPMLLSIMMTLQNNDNIIS